MCKVLPEVLEASLVASEAPAGIATHATCESLRWTIGAKEPSSPVSSERDALIFRDLMGVSVVEIGGTMLYIDDI